MLCPGPPKVDSVSTSSVLPGRHRQSSCLTSHCRRIAGPLTVLSQPHRPCKAPLLPSEGPIGTAGPRGTLIQTQKCHQPHTAARLTSLQKNPSCTFLYANYKLRFQSQINFKNLVTRCFKTRSFLYERLVTGIATCRFTHP